MNTSEEAEMLIAHAEAAVQAGRYNEAEQLANEVLTRNPAQAVPEREGFQESVSSLSSSFPSDESRDEIFLHARAHCVIGTVVWRRGNYSRALEHFAIAQAAYEATGNRRGISDALNGIGMVYAKNSDYVTALENYQKALGINEELGNQIGIARTLGNIGIVYKELGDYAQALECYQKALAIHQELGSNYGIAVTLSNIGNVYGNVADYPKAQEYLQKSLALYYELGKKDGIAACLTNIGIICSKNSDYNKALDYYQKALVINEELGRKDAIIANLTNIGNVQLHISNYMNAVENYQKALVISEAIGTKGNIAGNLSNLGTVYAKPDFVEYDPLKAEQYLLKAKGISEETGVRHHLYTVHKSLADLYETEKRWEDFAIHFKKFYELEREVQNEEVKKQAKLMEQSRQAADREKKIAVANAKHQATEQLLHNVLPPSIAEKMLEGTTLIAEKLSNVSVLFADIVGFTVLSQSISPEELVEGLDKIFTAFDELAEKHGVEKIKTIGDAYMVVAGAPEPRPDHAEAMAQMGIEMMEVIKQFRAIATGETIRIRIGIHTGEVVAGVIGKKKFSFDLWGDAVNTAARMESHGAAGKIHVTSDFVQHLQKRFTMAKNTNHGIVFHQRKQINIKGKGMMRTYYLEKSV